MNVKYKFFNKFVMAESGSALVEFALVLPLMLVVATGIGTFGVALNHYLELTNGVSLAAQQVALQRSQGTDPCAIASQTLTEAAPYIVSSSVTLTTVVYTGSATSPTANSFSGTTCAGASGDLTQGDPVQVTATYPCTLTGYGLNLPCNLTAQVTEIVQ